jgi:NAD-dependent dihydropyrimidine dehydrogenase PreA subunit
LDHPILNAIRANAFTPLGWFSPVDMGDTKFVILIGNVGVEMFRRFATQRDEQSASMDEWTKAVVDPLASTLGARAVYPFDVPHQPFLTWARLAGAGHVSPLGLNIHSTFGLWHAYRAALLFPVEFDLPRNSAGAHPCESCADKPCLSACPVAAFDGEHYNVAACGQHILSADGSNCMTAGCLARRACPVGKAYQYHPRQIQFHMRAFQKARERELT